MSRNKKTTKYQMELMVNFLENNPIVISGKTHPLEPEEVERKWDELTNLLNNSPNGARKLKKQWKTLSFCMHDFLYEWKSKTKKKARLHIQNISQTGGGGYVCGDLNEIENRLISVLGWVHIIGCVGAPEEVNPDFHLDGIYSEIVEPAGTEHLDDCNNIEFIIEENDVANVPNESSKSKFNEVTSKANKTGTEHPDDCNNIEFILEENAVTNFPNESLKCKIKEVKSKVKKTGTSSSSKIERSAQLYCQSTDKMASAVRELASAISTLSEAISGIAEALKCLKKD